MYQLIILSICQYLSKICIICLNWPTNGRNELISNSRKGTPFLLKTTLKMLIRSSKLNTKWFLLIISIKDWSICLLAYKSNISKFIKKYTLYR